VALAERAAALAAPAISGFCVGAVALGLSGRAYVGVNVELPGVPLQGTIHAEHFAMASAVANGDEKGFRAIGVTASPCGHCRQALAELEGSADLTVYLRGEDGVVQGHSLRKELLPHAVTAELLPDAANAAGLATFGLVPSDAAKSLSAQEEAGALASMSGSFAPYSRSPSGCAIVTAAGEVFAGSYRESVAFNPGVPPFQAGFIELTAQRLGIKADSLDQLAAAIAAVPKDFDMLSAFRAEAKRVLLVQLAEGAAIDHHNSVREFVASLCPDAELVSLRASHAT